MIRLEYLSPENGNSGRLTQAAGTCTRQSLEEVLEPSQLFVLMNGGESPSLARFFVLPAW